jgi:hypothetical protein
MQLKEPADNTRMFRTLMTIQALSYFEYNLRLTLKAEDSVLLDNDLIELLLRDIDLECIPKRAICDQKYYMRQDRDLYM